MDEVICGRIWEAALARFGEINFGVLIDNNGLSRRNLEDEILICTVHAVTLSIRYCPCCDVEHYGEDELDELVVNDVSIAWAGAGQREGDC